MKPYLVAGALNMALLFVVGLVLPLVSGASPIAPPAPADLPSTHNRPASTVGSSRCAGAACHGQEKPHVGNTIRLDEYLLWNLWDPHAHAYHALEGRHAQQIIANLAAFGEFKEATQEARCLVCHTDPHFAVAPSDERQRVHAVGCESCHGPAERWLNPHHAKPQTPRKQLEQLGMRNLSDESTLAEVCVSCHVGAPATDGQPAREVTHDLLAAGHPRLNFELTCYLANLPPHWNAEEKIRRRKQGFEAKVWAAGQVAAAQVSLQILADQARRGSPWPEFAAHDCEACHMPLRPHTKSSGKTLPMSRWSVALLPEIGASLPEASRGPRGITERLAEVKILLERPQKNAGSIAEKADAIAAYLTKWRKSLSSWRIEPASLMKQIGRHAPANSWNWEEATQRYLALWALEQVRSSGAPGETHRHIQNELLEMADKLAFPPSYSGPKAFSDENLKEHFRKIRQRLGVEDSATRKNP